MNDSKLRLGFIGCGGIIKNHLQAGLGAFEDVDLVGWCDPKRENAEARKAENGDRGAIFSDPATMLAELRPDAVYIALPPFAHGEVEDAVLAAGVPFFIEKPVSIDMQQAQRVREAVAEQGLITSVGYQNRYRASTRRVRELFAGQTAVMAMGGWLGAGPGEDSPIFGWWTRRARSGGQFIEQTTHTTDLVRYFFGEAVSVHAQPVKDRRPRPAGYDIEDASMVQIGFANGAAATIASSCCTSLGGGVFLTVWGTDMRADFTGWEHSVSISLPDGEEAIAEDRAIFQVEDRAFVDAVKQGDQRIILASYEDGYQATLIGCAANASMDRGEGVQLEEFERQPVEV